MKHIRSSISFLKESALTVVLAKNYRILFVLYLLSAVLFFLYSFTQVDLGLTITRSQFIFEIQRAFQYIGYFNRPLATLLFIALSMVFFITYVAFIRLVVQKKITLQQVIGMLVLTAPVLAFSYNAFSHDIFNYIFDAKIVTFYQENPYLKKALDFPTDPMLGFMHWTHRVYPYGPVWLLLSVPISYLGLQYFIPTLVLFKLFTLLAFALTVLGVGKIVQKLYPQHVLLAVTVFALNPLLLIESLLSAHNDIFMMGFAVWALYWLIRKKYSIAYVLLFLSIGVKFATIFLLPIFFYVTWMQLKNKTVSWEKVFLYSCSAMILAILAAIARPSLSNFTFSINATFQPWYLLFVLPFTSLLAHRFYVTIPMIILSFIALLNYVPYLYLGNYDAPVPMILNSMNGVGVGIGLIVMLFIMTKRNTHHDS